MIYYPIRSKPVIQYSGDAFVYINGVQDVFACRLSHGRVNFTDDIMSCSVDLGIDNAPGSATMQLSVPRHSSKQYFKFGQPVFKTMQEVSIFMKGRFLSFDGQPIYYQVFWGLVVDVNVDYSGGKHNITITCADILYWWSVTRVNTRPSVFGQAWDSTLRITEFINVFHHMTPHQVMIALARVMMGSLTPPQNFPTFGKGKFKVSQSIFARENEAAMYYWQQRNRDIGKRLRLFGASPGNSGSESISGTVTELNDTFMSTNTDLLKILFGKSDASSFENVRNNIGVLTGDQKATQVLDNLASQGKVSVDDIRMLMGRATSKAAPFSLDGSLFDQFYPYNQEGQVGDFLSGEDMSRLEVASQVKEFIGFEFFMDPSGEIIFKPPFYNLDVRENDPVSIIRDEDILSFDVGEHARDLITRLDVRGAWTTYYLEGDSLNIPFGSAIDYNLARTYGLRHESVSRYFLPTSELCTLYAFAELSRFNAKRYSGNLTILGRPELKLGYPVYIEPIDSFFYVSGISHSYSASGRSETVLRLEARRSKYTPKTKRLEVIEKDASGKPTKVREVLNSMEGYSWDNSDVLRPRIKGVANVVLTMDIPDSIEADEGARVQNKKVPESLDLNKLKITSAAASGLQVGGRRELEAQLEGVESSTLLDSLTQGVTNFVQEKILTIPDKDALIYGDIELIMSRYARGAAGIQFQTYGATREIVKKDVFVANLSEIPVSDEFGYELIGGFGYGRGVKLLPTGELRTFIKATRDDIKTTAEGQNEALIAELQKKSFGLARITTEVDLKITPPGDSFSVAQMDFNSHILGRGDGESPNASRAMFLTDWYSVQSLYSDDLAACQLAETQGAFLVDARSRQLEAGSFEFQYGIFEGDNPTTSAFGDLPGPSIRQQDPSTSSAVPSDDPDQQKSPPGEKDLQNFVSSPGKYQWPCPGYSVSSNYGWRRSRFHYGTDIGAPYNSKILSIADGTVVYATPSGGYGHYILIEHADGIRSGYAHMFKHQILVTAGQKVKKGDQIAKVGYMGNVSPPGPSGSHLHLEVTFNGAYINPMDLFR